MIRPDEFVKPQSEWMIVRNRWPQFAIPPIYREKNGTVRMWSGFSIPPNLNRKVDGTFVTPRSVRSGESFSPTRWLESKMVSLFENFSREPFPETTEFPEYVFATAENFAQDVFGLSIKDVLPQVEERVKKEIATYTGKYKDGAYRTGHDRAERIAIVESVHNYPVSMDAWFKMLQGYTQDKTIPTVDVEKLRMGYQSIIKANLGL